MFAMFLTRHRGWIGAIMIAALLLFGLGALVAVRGRLWLVHEYKRVSFQWIADRVTAGAHDPQEAVERLFLFVHHHVVVPPYEGLIRDVEPQEILGSGWGYCDQQANVFVQLARAIPLDARLVFLRDADGASPHSIAEVYLDGAWRAVDPLLGVLIRNAEGRLATPEEVAEDPALLTRHPEVRRLIALGATTDYAQMAGWYQQPPTIFNTWHGKRKAWLDWCPEPFRRWIVYALQDAYFAVYEHGGNPWQPQRQRARQYAFLGRVQAAERILRRLARESDDAGRREDGWFFLGRLYQSEGRFDEALAAFQASFREARSDRWKRTSSVGMGEVYEALGEPDHALEAYEASGLMASDPMVARRVGSLRVSSTTSGS